MSARRLSGAIGPVVALLVVLGLAGSVALGRPTTPEYWRDPGATDQSRGLQELAASLNARERALARREAAYAQKEADLGEAEKRLEERLAELQGLRGELEGLLEGMDDDQEDRVRALVKAIENMRPKQAAAMLEKTERALAVQVLDRMTRTKAGRAMAAMEPRTAATLAEMMAEPPAID